jgi:cytochrome P450
LSESLRLFPPAPAIARVAIEGASVRGTPIQAGTLIVMSPFIVQRDARYFPDSLQFRPERWSARPEHAHKFAYFPFGGGVHRCVGEALAWAEGTLILSLIAKEWRMLPISNAKVDWKPSEVLRPRTPIHMRLVSASQYVESLHDPTI